MVRAKGVTAAAHLDYLKKTFGSDAPARVLSAIPSAAHRGQLEGQILSSAWLPFDALMALDAAADRVLGKGDGALARSLGAYASERDLKTVYRIFMQVLSVETVLAKASAMWHLYYDSGEMAVLEKRKGQARLELRGFATPHALLCESVIGFMERTARLAGAKTAAATHPECRTEGGPRCVFDIRWT